MLKQLLLFLSIIQLTQCLSTRSNSKWSNQRGISNTKSFVVWWSRRNENSQQDCDIELNNENPSLEAKICGRKKTFSFF
jgi:hypothetical protein